MVSFKHWFAVLFLIVFFSCEAKSSAELFNYKIYSPYKNSKIHVLTIDSTKADVVLKRAHDIGAGLATVANLATKFNAHAAINGGYFRFSEQIARIGIPAGVLKVDNKWYGIAYKPRAAIGWNPNTLDVLFDIVQTKSSINWQGKKFPINVMNNVTSNKAILYSDVFSTIKNRDSLDISILNNVVQDTNSYSNVVVPNGGYVYSVKGELAERLSGVRIGDTLELDINIMPLQNINNAEDWQQMSFILGAGPLLINNGKKIEDFSIEQMDTMFIQEKDARSAIGILDNKSWVFVMVEYSLFEEYVGFSIPELRDFMFDLGCVAAMNLDGGSSSAMYIKDIKTGSIFDQAVADAVLVIPKN